MEHDGDLSGPGAALAAWCHHCPVRARLGTEIAVEQDAGMTGGVQVLPWRSDLGSVLLALSVWVLVFGGRVVCTSCQRLIPLTALAVPLPLEVTVRLQQHHPR